MRDEKRSLVAQNDPIGLANRGVLADLKSRFPAHQIALIGRVYSPRAPNRPTSRQL